jgi:ribosome maturation factor RimP
MALQLDTIRNTAERVAASHHLELVDLEFSGGAKFRTLRVFIEKDAAERAKLVELAKAAEAGDPLDPTEPVPVWPSGVPVEALSGVTHEDCEQFARDFGTVLDVEVSSPGLERKLSKPEEFMRFRGALIKVQTFSAIEGNRHFQGRLTDFDPQGRTLKLDPSAVKPKGKAKKTAAAALGGQMLELPLDNVEKANLIPEI